MISFLTLWITQLRRGKALVSYKQPTIWIHIFEEPKEKPHPAAIWFNHTPVVILETTFTNVGAKPVKIKSVRMRLLNKHITNRSYALVDVLTEPIKQRRGESYTEAVIRTPETPWTPLLLFPNKPQTEFIFFKSDFGAHISKGHNTLVLEMRSGFGLRWKKIGKWQFDVTNQVYDWLEEGAAFGLPLDWKSKKETNAPK